MARGSHFSMFGGSGTPRSRLERDVGKRAAGRMLGDPNHMTNAVIGGSLGGIFFGPLGAAVGAGAGAMMGMSPPNVGHFVGATRGAVSQRSLVDPMAGAEHGFPGYFEEFEHYKRKGERFNRKGRPWQLHDVMNPAGGGAPSRTLLGQKYGFQVNGGPFIGTTGIIRPNAFGTSSTNKMAALRGMGGAGVGAALGSHFGPGGAIAGGAIGAIAGVRPFMSLGMGGMGAMIGYGMGGGAGGAFAGALAGQGIGMGWKAGLRALPGFQQLGAGAAALGAGAFEGMAGAVGLSAKLTSKTAAKLFGDPSGGFLSKTGYYGGRVLGGGAFGAALGGALGGAPGAAVGMAAGVAGGALGKKAFGVDSGLWKTAGKMMAKHPGAVAFGIGSMLAGKAIYRSLSESMSERQMVGDYGLGTRQAVYGMDPNSLNVQGLTLALHYRR